MNTETLSGQWEQLKGHVLKQWGKLTQDDVDQIRGNAKILAGKLQERYGRTKEQAEQEVNKWLDARKDAI